jgi:hypothetical protein
MLDDIAEGQCARGWLEVRLRLGDREMGARGVVKWGRQRSDESVA